MVEIRRLGHWSNFKHCRENNRQSDELKKEDKNKPQISHAADELCNCKEIEAILELLPVQNLGILVVSLPKEDHK